MRAAVPEIRRRELNDSPINPDGNYVLYWMIASRRLNFNFALQRAVEYATELQRPLLVLEPLRVKYDDASDRLHRFVMQGMAANRQACEGSLVRYYPYVEPEPNHGHGLVEHLAAHAAVVVTDDYPCFFLPTLLRLMARRLTVRLEAIDSNGLLPLAATDHAYPTAYAFRRFLQKALPQHLAHFPVDDPLINAQFPAWTKLPAGTVDRWPDVSEAELSRPERLITTLPIDHEVGPASFDGGAAVAKARLNGFLKQGLAGYVDNARQPDDETTSGLSPWLHFGHISSHEIFRRIAAEEDWDPEHLSGDVRGAKEGWWGMSPSAEAFLDQLVTWREVGFNMCVHRTDYDRYESLPDWAQVTLTKHASDERPALYSLEEFEQAATHDEIWNAAQRQLVRDGKLVNYLRMLWGKKILHWTESPQQALEVMLHLNNKYAVDGRDPNSYSGIFWVLGRYDRPWGPERTVFGKIRYMTSDSTRRKLQLDDYLRRYGEDSPTGSGGTLF